MEDLTGRYLKYIGNNMNRLPKFGDYFLIQSMNGDGLLRLKDNEPHCHWVPDNYKQSFELMFDGFNPEIPIYEIY